MKNLFDINGKVIVITGGCGILGRGIALYLAEQGAKIVILDRMEEISKELENLFAFVEKIFGTGNEMLILVTDLTVNANSMKFISRKGSKEYFKYNKKYQLYERQQEISDALEQLQI